MTGPPGHATTGRRGGAANPLAGRPFVKMSGGGNDFVLFDDRDGAFPTEGRGELVARLCRRGLGIGADAVLLLQSSGDADFRMVYHNADGGEAPMCGNGAMCIARYARMAGAVEGETMEFETGSGRFRARVADPADPSVTLWLVPPRNLALRIDELETDPYERVGFLDTSTPHVVALVGDVESHDVPGEGRRIRRHPRFDPPGTNVNFVEVRARDRLRMRTYERGVEAETLSCGTGATASALLAHLWGEVDPPVTVLTSGGLPLVVDFAPSRDGALPTEPRLTGDARVVYRGTVEEA